MIPTDEQLNRAMTAWTSMEDTWPEHKAEVLAWGRLAEGDQTMRCYQAGFYQYPTCVPYWLTGTRMNGAREIVGVTHWMPLPEPPVVGQGEEAGRS